MRRKNKVYKIKTREQLFANKQAFGIDFEKDRDNINRILNGLEKAFSFSESQAVKTFMTSLFMFGTYEIENNCECLAIYAQNMKGSK